MTAPGFPHREAGASPGRRTGSHAAAGAVERRRRSCRTRHRLVTPASGRHARAGERPPRHAHLPARRRHVAARASPRRRRAASRVRTASVKLSCTAKRKPRPWPGIPMRPPPGGLPRSRAGTAQVVPLIPAALRRAANGATVDNPGDNSYITAVDYPSAGMVASVQAMYGRSRSERDIGRSAPWPGGLRTASAPHGAPGSSPRSKVMSTRTAGVPHPDTRSRMVPRSLQLPMRPE